MEARGSANLYLKNTGKRTSPVLLLGFLQRYGVNVGEVEVHDIVAAIIGLGAGGSMNVNDVARYVKRGLEELRGKGIPVSEEFDW
jgi:hypothetical protein